MRRTLHRLLSYIVMVVLCVIPTAAQTGRGVVEGTVKDSAGVALQGASVELQPLGRRVVTDELGQFRIPEVPAGSYTLVASYVGFAAFSGPVTIQAGQTTRVDAKLNVASQTDQVIVTAERPRGEAEAINIERTSENIVQVLPSQVINSLPNTNVADAVGRLPSVSLERDEGEGKYVQIRGTEPRLSNVTINGVNVPTPEGIVRQIKLDAVPADLVERIEVFKTLSANQDADGIGGTVNLVTKVAGERPTYDFRGSGGYTPIHGGRTLGEFDSTLGERFLENKKLGFIVSGTWDRNDRGIDDLEPTQAATTFNGQPVAYVSSEDLRSYAYYRTRYGFGTGIDYNLKPGTNAYIKGLYSDFHDFGDTWVYTPNAGSTIKSVNGSQITFDNASDCAAINAADPTANCSPGGYAYRHYIRRPDQQLFSVLTGVRQDLGATLLTYEFAGSRGHNIGGQDFPTTNFSGNTADVALDLSNRYRPKMVPLDGSNPYDPSQYTISTTVFPRYHATQVNYQGAASYARRYTLWSHFSTFEMGLKIRNSATAQNENDQFFNVNSTATSPVPFTAALGTDRNPTYYDRTFTYGGMPYGPSTDYKKIVQAFFSNQGVFQFDPVTSQTRSAGATFGANERVYAGYLQDSITIAKLRLQAGVRFEGTNTHFLANQVTTQCCDASGNPLPPAISPLRQDAGYWNALPSVQAQYQIETNTNLRFNYSQGISRPNIGDLVPATTVDPNASPKSVSTGNANLKPTKANNYDVLAEHYFQPLGILQAGFFYKQLSDPIYPTAFFINSGPLAGFLESQSINGPSAHITGFETAWQQRFSFLPGMLRGFGVFANYSYTTSYVTFPANFSGGRTDHPTLQRTAPNTGNFNLTYDNSRFSGRFAVSYNDANLWQYAFQQNSTPKDPILGLKGPTGDIYLYAHTQYDVQGSYRLYKGLSLFAYGLNLSNEVFGFYQGSGIYPIQREYYHPTVAVGLRWSSAGEFAEK